MPAFDPWDVIKVPFPYTDRPVRERRPALVLATEGIEERHGLMWVLMITSAENRSWPGDVPVSELGPSGLPVASVVRTAKIATIETKEAERIGRLPQKDRPAVSGQVLNIVGAAILTKNEGVLALSQDALSWNEPSLPFSEVILPLSEDDPVPGEEILATNGPGLPWRQERLLETEPRGRQRRSGPQAP